MSGAERLRGMTVEQLDKEASEILHGKRNARWVEPCDIVSVRHHIRRPKSADAEVTYRKPKNLESVCGECRKPKSYGSAELCRRCYLLACGARYHSSIDAAEWLEGMGGPTMPETEWWDDTFIGTQPKRAPLYSSRFDWDNNA